MELKTTLNGCNVRRRDGTIFVKLPRGQWREIEGGCQCRHCKEVPGRKAYWDTLAVADTSIDPRDDYTWTVHQPENHPHGLSGREIDREGNVAE